MGAVLDYVIAEVPSEAAKSKLDLQKRPCDPGLSHGTLFGQTCLKGCLSCRLWCRVAHLAR